MSTQQEIQEILGDFSCGISLSHWSAFHKSYQLKFDKPLDYKSLGVTDDTQLLKVMRETLVFFKMQNEIYVMSAPVAKLRRERLKLNVEKLLYIHGGKIVFDSFENFYKDQFKANLFYGYYGLTDLDHLCRIFENYLVLVVEEEKSSGKKMGVVEEGKSSGKKIGVVEEGKSSGKKMGVVEERKSSGKKMGVVEEGNSSGKKMIKAVKGMYNLRTRKK